MVRANGRLALSLGALCVLLFSAATSAQENSGIAGVARDTSGGVLPGVTVEAASPAGFGTVKREGIELSAGFTATVNADLQVGTLAETVTVTGATPLVDTQNVRKQIVASKDLLDSLPTSTKHINMLVTLTPGFTGVTPVDGRYAAEPASFHGKRGTKVSFDGMGVENSSGN